MDADAAIDDEAAARLRASEERLRLAEAASGIGTFEFDLATGRWEWTPQVAVLFGFDSGNPQTSSAATGSARSSPTTCRSCARRSRARRETGTIKSNFASGMPTAACTGSRARVQIVADPADRRAGCTAPITTSLTARRSKPGCWRSTRRLEARVAEVREEARTLEILNRTGVAVAAELDLGAPRSRP